MRRFIAIISMLMLVAFTMPAQQRLVDEVKKSISDLTANAETYKKAREKLKPALKDSTSKGKAETWWVATKVEWGYYDKLLTSKSLGKKPDSLEMGNALLAGYDHSIKALSLDTTWLINRDGTPKIDKKTGQKRYKTKFSANIVSRTAHYIESMNRAGSDFYNSSKWAEAYKAFDIYNRLATDPTYSKLKRSEPDSVIGQVLFYQGLAAFQLKRYDDAHRLMAKARTLGYNKKEVFDSDINALVLAHDTSSMVQVAHEAYKHYGNHDIQYIRILINDLVKHQNYRDAEVMLDQAILSDSTNAEYYDLKGNIVEFEADYTQARPYYLHATKIDTTFAQGYFDAGRTYYLEALDYKKINPKATGRKYAKTVAALYQQAMVHLERAHALTPEDERVNSILRDIYYKLGYGDKLVILERGI